MEARHDAPHPCDIICMAPVIPRMTETNLTPLDAGTRSGGGEQKRTSAKRPLVVSSAQPLAKRRRRASTGGVLAQDPAGENKYTK